MWRRNDIKLSLFYFLTLWNFMNQCATKSNEITHCSRVMMHSCRACSMHPLLWVDRILPGYSRAILWLADMSGSRLALMLTASCYTFVYSGVTRCALNNTFYSRRNISHGVSESENIQMCLIRWMCETRGNFRMTRDWPETDTHVRSGFQNKGVHLRSRW